MYKVHSFADNMLEEKSELTGIIRKVDELGRIVIPKEMRRILNIKTGSNVEIIIEEDNAIVLKKFSQISNLHTFADELALELHNITGKVCLVCDEDNVVSSSGGNKKELNGKKISISSSQKCVPSSSIISTNRQYGCCYISPLFCDGYVSGYAVVMADDEITGEIKKSVEALTSFFSRLLNI